MHDREAVTSIITDRIGEHKVLLPINHNCYNFWKTDRLRTNISGETVSKLKNSSTLETPQLFKDKWLFLWLLWSNLWWIWLKGQNMIGCLNCLITGVRLQPTMWLHCLITTQSTKWLVENKAATAPITFEEIVMVMIKFIKK